MNLDDFTLFSQLDPDNMLAEIDSLPAQLQTAWELGQRQPLPAWPGIQRVLISGMGGSAIGADLLAAYAEPLCRAPLVVHRDYGLPAWASGAQTLVIVSSHSGDTEETLSGFQQGVERGCCVLAVTTGGALADAAQPAGAALWPFVHRGQPRAAVGFSFGLLLSALARLGLLPDPAAELGDSVAAMRSQQAGLKADIPVTKNPAKRLAGQLMGRWVTFFGAGLLAPVARRWKGQMSEVAKAWAQFEFLPEADHNTLAGTQHPGELLSRLAALFLRAPSDHPRNRLRADLTRRALMLEGIGTDTYDAPGQTRMAQQWAALHFGDYTAYYLAMLYGVDPTPVAALVALKEALKAAG